jgi:hypothetical protein
LGSFTSALIAKAMINAHKRQGKVEVILDRSQRTKKNSPADFFANSGIATKIDDVHAIAHNKETDYVYYETPNFFRI